MLTLKPILSSDPNSHLLARRPDQRMNLWGTIYLHEEEKIEEVDQEDDGAADQLPMHGLKNTNSSDFSFSHVYEDKEESNCIFSLRSILFCNLFFFYFPFFLEVDGGWDDNDQSNNIKRLNTMSADLENIYSLNFSPPIENRKKKIKKTVVKIQAMFKADMLSEIIQDWM